MYNFVNELLSSQDIYDLYEELGWNQYVKKSKEELIQIMNGSYYVLYVYDKKKLIATGRMISDGYLSALICGVGVDPQYQKRGLGKDVINHLIKFGEEQKLFVELTCRDGLESYYEQFDFKKYGIAMK